MICEKIGVEAIDQHLDKDEIDEMGKIKLKIIANSLDFAVKDIASKLGKTNEEILKCLNEKLVNVQYATNDFDHVEYALVDPRIKTMRFFDKFFQGYQVNRKELTVHETTHALGSDIRHKNFKKIYISGYKIIEKFMWMHKIFNAGFNEAATQMFASYNNEYKEGKFLDYDIYTNQIENQSIYKININLIHQMIIANNLTDKDLFNGLFNYDDSIKFKEKFDKKTFEELSRLMDDIYMNAYKISQTRLNLYVIGNKEIDKLIKDELSATINLKKATKNAEEIIINNILVPRLQGKSIDEKTKILQEYGKYVVSEKKTFNQIVENVVGKKEFLDGLQIKENTDNNSLKIVEEIKQKEASKESEELDK